MAITTLRRIFSGKTPVLLLLVLLLASLYLMSGATHNSALFSRLYSVLLGINALAIVLLVTLIGKHMYRLVRQYRQHVAGSRLTARLVIMFIVLAVTPVSVVYYFSLDFLQRGIDSWFDVRVEKALDDSLELSRTSLDVRMRELLRQTRQMTPELANTPDSMAALALNDIRTDSDATELTLFSANGRIIASSGTDTSSIVPARPDDATMLQLRQGSDYVGLDPIRDSGLHVRVAVRVPSPNPVGEARVLQALYPVTERMNTLANSVQAAYAQYKELAYLRKPLKYSFILTLSLVLLLSLLTAVWAAFFSARRLVAPITDLAEGTRAVAAGNYDKRLPLPGKDELGFLVRSFNEMTHKIALARDAAARSQEQAEAQHAYLEAVLVRLSSGVLTIDRDRVLHTSNRAADQILGVELGEFVGRSLDEVRSEHPHTRHFIDAITPHVSDGEQEWRDEIILFGAGGRQVLMCRGTRLPDVAGIRAGHVLVFDDITALIQAQRDAAWGEVARRLAHEIKNPLTPIQLSAERLRHKYLGKMNAKDADVLDRSTHTIVQQVEAMKEMVKAFSDYARMPQLDLEPIDLNAVINEVLDLYRGDRAVKYLVNLDAKMPRVEGDIGRLRQLLHNLIKNALEAMESRGDARLSVTTRCMEEASCRFVEIRVQDNGPGIPSEMLGQLFEPYVTTKPKGTGLGLAIVKKIVEEHGGLLWAENPNTGGALVVIRLPVLTSNSVDAEEDLTVALVNHKGNDDAAA
ncbi:MAG TPA: ATP-binding protein [Gammaproteobacteria bacterium]|nr:ATP-binding protein [Gammaproteobacteria bacterium]